MSDDKNTNPNQEGADANLDNFKPKTDDEIRESVVGDLGLDAENDKELIDKVATQRIEDQKKLSTAIKQKISYREKLEEAENKKVEQPNQPAQNGNPSNSKSDDEWRQEVEFIASNRQFDKDDVSQLKIIAKGSGLSLEEASKNDLFKGYIEAKQEKERKEKAELGVSSRGASSSNEAPTGDKWREHAEKKRDELLGNIKQ